jgi:hypothetical protein
VTFYFSRKKEDIVCKKMKYVFGFKLYNYSSEEASSENREAISFPQTYDERSGDISGRPTAILQFSSEMQQTWHSYY